MDVVLDMYQKGHALMNFLSKVVRYGVFYGIQNVCRASIMLLVAYVLLIAKMV